MDDKIKELQLEYEKREALYGQLDNQRRAVRAALDTAVRKLVNAELDRIYGPTAQHLALAVFEAKNALTEAKEQDALAGEGAPAPIGTVYEEWKSSWSMLKNEITRKTGRVAALEAVTRESEFADNLRYGRPSPGTFVLRLLKKDGTPSKKCVPLQWRVHENPAIPSGWVERPKDLI